MPSLTPDLIGKTIRVERPLGIGGPVQGELIAIQPSPTLIIQTAGGRQHFPASMHWTVVELAPEPPSGSAVATDLTVWLRGHYGWFDGFAGPGEPELLTWAQLNSRHPEVTRLVRDERIFSNPGVPLSADAASVLENAPKVAAAMCTAGAAAGPGMSDLEQLWESVQQRLRYATDWRMSIDPWGSFGCVVATITESGGDRSDVNFGVTLAKRLRWALTVLPPLPAAVATNMEERQ